MSRRLRVLAGVALAAALFAAGAGGRMVLASSESGDESVIHACRDTKTGTLRTVDAPADCDDKKESPLSWNVAGPEGPQGPPGPAGPSGPAGDGDWLAECWVDGGGIGDCATQAVYGD